jgi:hypothetical protein
MQPRRNPVDDDRGDSCEKLVLASETLRSASHRQPKTEPVKSGEERISMFWRIFGGTILSIAALVIITVYQSIGSSIHELRNEVSRANEARAELLKKDEFSAAKAKIWDHFQEIQKDQKTALTPVTQMQQAVAGLQEKTTLRDQQFQQAQEEHKELVKEIQALRERLAKLEGAKSDTKASTAGR